MLTSLVSLLLVLPLQATTPTAQITPSGSTQATAGPIHGPVQGLWRLPGPQGPGHMRGVLLAPLRVPLFVLDAAVLADPTTPAKGGEIKGVLKALHGPMKGKVVAYVHGQWAPPATAAEPGKFAAVIARPTGPSTPPELIGKIGGAWFDPNGPQPPAGKFKGHWILKKP